MNRVRWLLLVGILFVGMSCGLLPEGFPAGGSEEDSGEAAAVSAALGYTAGRAVVPSAAADEGGTGAQGAGTPTPDPEPDPVPDPEPEPDPAPETTDYSHFCTYGAQGYLSRWCVPGTTPSADTVFTVTPGAGKIHKVKILIWENTLNATSNWKIRVNGDPGMLLVVNPGQTGEITPHFPDTSEELTLAAGDTIAFMITGSSTTGELGLVYQYSFTPAE